jgi:hypothetical protein
MLMKVGTALYCFIPDKNAVAKNFNSWRTLALLQVN